MEKSKKQQQKAFKKKNKKNVPKTILRNEKAANDKSASLKASFLKRQNELLRSLGFDPKKEWMTFGITLAILIVCGLFLSFYVWNFYLLIPTIVLSALYAYLSLERPKDMLKCKKERLRMEFVKLFSFLRVFLSNGHSVYSALLETRSYAEGDAQILFDKLIEGIDANKTIEPYLEFADAFDSIEIKQAMIATYELSLDGGKERFYHFDSVFQRISEEKRDEAFFFFRNKLANMNFFPLIGSAFSMALVTIAVVALMGNTNYGF
ncbi:MAG TPA: hypothetical protein DCZ41_00785 [Firmicutes bacterium]|nr:hypothetical protein [Bacillota bacterium]